MKSNRRHFLSLALAGGFGGILASVSTLTSRLRGPSLVAIGTPAGSKGLLIEEFMSASGTDHFLEQFCDEIVSNIQHSPMFRDYAANSGITSNSGKAELFAKFVTENEEVWKELRVSAKSVFVAKADQDFTETELYRINRFYGTQEGRALAKSLVSNSAAFQIFEIGYQLSQKALSKTILG